MSKNDKSTFVKGAFILGAAGLICKVIGAFFRIPLYNMLGDGMQYYEAVYPYYSTLLVISSAGLPTAISRMVAERAAVGDMAGAKRVFRKSQLLLAIIGVVTTALMYFGADFLARSTVGPLATPSFRVMSPALLIVSLMCSYRGYLQGLQQMTGTAMSQLAEQAGKLAIGLFLAARWMPRGLEYGAMGAVAGVTLSELLALIVVGAFYLFRKRDIELNQTALSEPVSDNNIIRGLFAIAIPVTIGASIMPITGIADASLIKNTLLSIGFSEVEASMRYVALRSNVTNIINMPAVLTIALAMSLVPAISAARTAKNKKAIHTVSAMGIKLAMFIGIPCAVGLFALSAPVIDLLYNIDEQRLAIASALMRTSAVGVIFHSLVQTLTGILQGAGKQHIPVVNLLIGGVVKVVLMLTLMRNPEIEIQGAAISTTACYIVAGVLNAIYLIRFTKLKLNVMDTFIKPLVASLIMGGAAYFSYGWIHARIPSNTIATAGAILVGVALYLIGILWMQMFTQEDLAFIPGGSILAKLQFRNRA
ncbi:MAG: polysaccharide biosynthesis protein [Eubacteriales bacterium]|nr:polysaccharide biosynthesis protein [Eubacteriales bacterium]